MNVAVEQTDSSSILTLYRELIALRKNHPTLVSGKLEELHVENNILRFRRSGPEEIEVILNMTREEISVHTPSGRLLLGTRVDREAKTGGSSALHPGEGVVFLLT